MKTCLITRLLRLNRGSCLGLLAAVMVMASITAVQGQYEYTVNGDNTNTITITGYTGPGGAVVIPSTIDGLTITEIGQDCLINGGAFYECTNLTSVTIPTTVTRIGDFAFRFCYRLASVKIPDTVTRIGSYSFSDCISLTNVMIGNGVTSIGGLAFYNCRKLTRVTIPDSVITFGGGVFCNCSHLTNVTIGNGVTNIECGLFEQCISLTNIKIPASVIRIGDDGFRTCPNLTSVYFKGNAPSVCTNAFAYGTTNATIYYLPGTTGWSTNFAGRPTKLTCNGEPTALTPEQDAELVRQGILPPLENTMNSSDKVSATIQSSYEGQIQLRFVNSPVEVERQN